MRRVLLVLLMSFMVLFTSCNGGLLEYREYGSFDPEFFDDKYEDDKYLRSPDSGSDNTIRALIVTDVHIGRHEGGCYGKDDLFFEWLEGESAGLDFSIQLGDLVDESCDSLFEEAAEFSKAMENKTGKKMFQVIGNHDNRIGKGTFSYYLDAPCYYRFDHKDVSFYVLDTSSRAMSRNQLDELKQALRKDSNVKIFFTHYPLNVGQIDYFYLGLVDPEQRKELVNLMRHNRVGFYFCGHRHRQMRVQKIADRCHELTLASFDGKQGDFESPVTWYVVELDTDESTIKIIPYIAYRSAEKVEDIVKGETLLFDIPE